MKPLLCIVFISLTYVLFGQQNIFPDTLTENAHQITVFDETRFIIESESKSITKRQYKIAVLDKFAQNARRIELYYSNFTTIKSASVLVTDRFGRKIESHNLKNFEDWSENGSNMATDSRSKYIEINHNTYPYYIEVSYESQNNGALHYPRWLPIYSWNHSLVSADFFIELNSADEVRFFGQFVSEPTVTISDDKKVYHWQVSNIPVLIEELFSPYYPVGMPIVFTAPNAFSMDGYHGNMNSWESLGKWQYLLNQDRHDLPKSELDKIASLASEYESNEEKVKVIYKYLQDNFRYVSIQLGIGGWQPFKTADVHEKKYGDCKALTFYTKNILEHIGIPAYYTLIKAGTYEPDIPKEFPIRMFNHAFLTVPMEKDTVFLECTSSSDPYGYLGTFTSDRYALLVKQEGGELIRTKAYSAEENLQITKAQLVISEDGNATANVSLDMHCLEIGDEYAWVLQDSKEKQKEWLYDNLDWGDIKINNFITTPITNERLPQTDLELDLSFDKIAKKTGTRMFFTPFIFNNLRGFQLPKEERVNPIEIKYPYSHIDSIEVHFPEGYEFENSLKNEELISEFGSYTRTYSFNEGKHIFIRKFIFNKGLYESSSYDEFRSFINKVQSLDGQKVVLIQI